MFNVSLIDIVVWLGISSIILLVTSEILSPHYGRIGLMLDLKKLRIVSIVTGIMFIIILITRYFLYIRG